MVQLSFFLIALLASTIEGAPLQKRIAQTIAASTAKWEQACLAAGGADKCNPLSVTAFSTLLAAAGPCAQQNAADQMIDLANTLGKDASMISLTQIFTQQPRNTPSSQSVPYCQQAPKNPELNGLFQCQFQGADPKVFVGGIQVGQTGTIPFGQNTPLSPPGSCPANPGGPIADGTQLVDLTQTPGAGNGGTPSPSPSGTAAGPSSPAAPNVPPSGSNPSTSTAGTPKNTMAAAAGDKSVTQPAGTPAATSASTTGSGFKLQNGKDAQKLNAQFATLTATSPCTAGQNACVDSGFAQCVDGKFVTTPCSSSLICAALPLVNKPGTSITCTTQADAAARIQATGATGGITGA